MIQECKNPDEIKKGAKRWLEGEVRDGVQEGDKAPPSSDD